MRKTMTSLSGIASSSVLFSVEQTHQLIPLILVTSVAQSDTVGVCQALGTCHVFLVFLQIRCLRR